MGGEHGKKGLIHIRYAYPPWVWSPTGGWWPQPRNWRKNTNVIWLGIIIFNITAYQFFKSHYVMDISMREVDKRIERKEMWERGLLTESDYDEELDDYHGVWDYVHGRKNPNDYKRFYMTDFKE